MGRIKIKDRMSSVNWKTNLAVIWASQLLSIAGFFFALPFGPYYIQELGVHDPSRIKFWVALFGAAPPLSLAIFSPFWGTLADRYGRSIDVFPRAGAYIFVCRSLPVYPAAAADSLGCQAAGSRRRPLSGQLMAMPRDFATSNAGVLIFKSARKIERGL